MTQRNLKIEAEELQRSDGELYSYIWGQADLEGLVRGIESAIKNPGRAREDLARLQVRARRGEATLKGSPGSSSAPGDTDADKDARAKAEYESAHPGVEVW